jgi:elongation factor 3
MNVLLKWCELDSKASAKSMVRVTPVLSELMWSTKKDVSSLATKLITELCGCIGNPDLEPFTPLLVRALRHPDEVVDTIFKLASTTFVQAITSGALAVITPLLVRGFNEREIRVKRRTCVVSENLLKLVADPSDISTFLPVLGPLLEKCQSEVADPECRERCGKALAVLKTLEVRMSQVSDEDVEQKVDESDENEDVLCDTVFSLAYGSNILLNTTRLRLTRGSRYGIVANKSAGKTTLLRSIAGYMIEGFPTKEELRTTFVETDISPEQTKMNVVEFVIDTLKEIRKLTKDEVSKTLTEMGFNDVMQNGKISMLSGGWKMKLALVRGMLSNTDIYLMDEPTNHLDVVNVQWVVDYLNGPLCKNVTSLIVSHDTKFLDKVCTHVIHFDNLKLKNYKGNLSKFVEVKPEIASFFDLSKTSLKFSFPKPALIPGIKSRAKKLMSLEKVWFRYPGVEKYQVKDVNVIASMASRVAIVGANGAGKSTMIKVLVGENEPTKGKRWVHPEMRFAYVAQHAFHHIELHLNKTPVEYVQWRYSSGMDKEALIKSTAVITEAEEAAMAKKIEWVFVNKDGDKKKEKVQIEKLLSRRKKKKMFEYEVKFVGKPMDSNVYMSAEVLEKFGWMKRVKELDARIVALEGLRARPLTTANVVEHFKNVGLDSEFSQHNRIRDLSGGQKVKIVLGACTWAQPHIIILDEPTNYLDRDALGALSNAISDFAGGVLLITHNQEFADSCCKTTWVVANNMLEINGDAEWEKYAAEAAADMHEDNAEVDSHGNKITKKTKAKPFEMLTAKEAKKHKKAIKKKIKAGRMLEEWEEEYALQWDLM